MRGSLAYLLLLRDDYPATDDLQEVTLEIAYPDVERHLNRFLPLVKWLLAMLALPPYVVLSDMWYAPFVHQRTIHARRPQVR